MKCGPLRFVPVCVRLKAAAPGLVVPGKRNVFLFIFLLTSHPEVGTLTSDPTGGPAPPGRRDYRPPGAGADPTLVG